MAYFAPLKREWRKVVEEARSAEGANWCSIPKEEFPRLLKTTMERIEPRDPDILSSAFRTTGIWPCNVEPLLNKLGSVQAKKFAKVAHGIGETLKVYLEEKAEMLKAKKEEAKKTRTKRSKINVIHGAPLSLSNEEVELAEKARAEAEAKKAAEAKNVSFFNTVLLKPNAMYRVL